MNLANFVLKSSLRFTIVMLLCALCAGTLGFNPVIANAQTPNALLTSGAGDLDPSFDGDGKVTTIFGAAETATAVAVQSDGKIVLAGNASDGFQHDFGLARYNTDGSLDTTFGAGGHVQTDFHNEDDAANGVVIQPDGKIVLVGQITVTPISSSAPDYRLALARYNADGSLDSSFGTSGKVITVFDPVPSGGNAVDGGRAIALQSDNKIVVAGFVRGATNQEIAVVRYNVDGSLDTSFDADGKVTTDIAGSTDSANALAIQPDNKIIVAGYARVGSTDDMALVRYNTDGSLDTSFDADGKLTTAIGAGNERANAILIQPDNKIVVGGYSFNGATTDAALVRYESNGALDNTFDADGKATLDYNGGTDVFSGVTLLADGKIIAAGVAYNGANNDFALARFNSNGSLDTSFGTNGKVLTNFFVSETARAIVQAGGKLVVVGNAGDRFIFDFAVARYNLDGTLDDTFSNDGKVMTDFGNSGEYADAIAVQPDGKLLVAGAHLETDEDFVIARYNTDGSLDNTFNVGGRAFADFGTFGIGATDDAVEAIALQPDGKIILAGRAENTIALARFNANGILDDSFGTFGQLVTMFPYATGFSSAFDVALQPDGKIIMVGVTHDDFAVARYNTDGTLDSSFGTGGEVTTGFSGYSFDEAKAVAILPNGKILVGGTTNPYSNSFFALARYNSDGSLDASFGAGGKVTTDFNNTNAQTDDVKSMAIQPDGKIILVGDVLVNTNLDYGLARYNSDGSLDASFGVSGKMTTPVGDGDDHADDVAVQADGRIVVCGRSFDAGHNGDDFSLARLNSNGALDTSFGASGKVLTPFGTYLFPDSALAIGLDGNIVVAGGAAPVDFYHYAVLRYLSGLNNDINFYVSNFTVNENGGAANITVTRTGTNVANAPASVNYATSDGSATAGVDYTATSGTLNFNAGETSKTFNIPIQDDSLREGNETINLSLTSPTNGATVGAQSTAVLSITDNEPLPSISINDVRVAEPSYGTTAATLTLNLSNASAQIVNVNFATANGTATSGADYQATSGVLTFNPLETSKQLNVVINADAVTESDETFFVNLNGATNAILADAQGIATITPPVPTILGAYVSQSGDFDGDGQTDIAVWRASNGTWYIVNSSDGSTRTQQWGEQSLGDVPVAADYDGDGKTDIAVWRASNGTWYIINSFDSTVRAQQWGEQTLGDIPVPGDFDGDGKADLAVWRATNGTWYIINSTDSSNTSQQWGDRQFGDVPVPGKYDADAKTDFAVWRAANGTWYIRNSADNSVTVQQWGEQSLGDIPVAGNYDGDARTDIAVWRASNGTWYVRNSMDNSTTVQQWGDQTLGDVPVPGNYDLDAKTDFAVWRATNGTWYVNRTSDSGVTVKQWGEQSLGDVPVSTSFVRRNSFLTGTSAAPPVDGDFPSRPEERGDGMSIEVSAAQRQLATLLYSPNAGADLTQTFALVAVPRETNAYTSDGALISGIRITPRFEGGAVQIEVALVTGKTSKVISRQGQAKRVEHIIGTHVLTENEAVTLTELLPFGLQPLEVRTATPKSATTP